MQGNKTIKKNKKNKQGFTLVELLVSIAVFMSVMVVAVSSLMSIIDANKKAQAIKSDIDNVTFAVESISRDMRMGTDYRCGNSTSESQGTINLLDVCEGKGRNAIQYVNANGDTIQYRFVSTPTIEENGLGNIQKKCVNCSPDNSWQSLTSPQSMVNITNMNFYILGVDSSSINRQPRVLITVEGKIINKNDTTEFNLQTTASQRARAVVD